jgi:hypothetical protein
VIALLDKAFGWRRSGERELRGFQPSGYKSDRLSSTEVGYVVEWPARIQGLDWQWQIPRKTVNYHFEPVGNDLFEIIIKVCGHIALTMVCRHILT